MRRIVIVVEGGDLGAALALAVAHKQGIADVSVMTRRDGSRQIVALAHASEARARWVKECRRLGQKVKRA